LRAILIVVAIVCLTLGWYTVRERRRSRLFDARQRIVEAVAGLYANTPPGWSITDSRMAQLSEILPLGIGSEKELAGRDPHFDRIMSRDSGGLWSGMIPLKSDRPIEIKDEKLPIEWWDKTEELSKDYGAQLVAAGMTEATSGHFIDDESRSAVFIEVEHGDGPDDALVKVIFFAPRP
jgi:hypothetical protein